MLGECTPDLRDLIQKKERKLSQFFLCSTDTEDRLHYTVLYKGLEHPRILLSLGVLEPVPHGYRGMTVLATC